MMNGGSAWEISAAVFSRNVPRAFFVEIESQRVRARLDGDQRVGEIRDAANFDPDISFTI